MKHPDLDTEGDIFEGENAQLHDVVLVDLFPVGQALFPLDKPKRKLRAFGRGRTFVFVKAALNFPHCVPVDQVPFIPRGAWNSFVLGSSDFAQSFVDLPVSGEYAYLKVFAVRDVCADVAEIKSQAGRVVPWESVLDKGPALRINCNTVPPSLIDRVDKLRVEDFESFRFTAGKMLERVHIAVLTRRVALGV